MKSVSSFSPSRKGLEMNENPLLQTKSLLRTFNELQSDFWPLLPVWRPAERSTRFTSCRIYRRVFWTVMGGSPEVVASECLSSGEYRESVKNESAEINKSKSDLLSFSTLVIRLGPAISASLCQLISHFVSVSSDVGLDVVLEWDASYLEYLKHLSVTNSPI